MPLFINLSQWNKRDQGSVLTRMPTKKIIKESNIHLKLPEKSKFPVQIPLKLSAEVNMPRVWAQWTRRVCSMDNQ